MKKVHVFIVLGLAILITMAFSLADKKDMPPAEGAEFWKYISETDPYTEWALWPGHEGMNPGQSPHGAYVRIYVNGIALKAINEKMEEMPAGAIIIKENYADDKETLAAITPMYKVKDFNPMAGDWFWANYGPEGKIVASGKVQGCIDCHRKMQKRDWLFTGSK